MRLWYEAMDVKMNKEIWCVEMSMAMPVKYGFSIPYGSGDLEESFHLLLIQTQFHSKPIPIVIPRFKPNAPLVSHFSQYLHNSINKYFSLSKWTLNHLCLQTHRKKKKLIV